MTFKNGIKNSLSKNKRMFGKYSIFKKNYWEKVGGGHGPPHPAPCFAGPAE